MVKRTCRCRQDFKEDFADPIRIGLMADASTAQVRPPAPRRDPRREG
jgi:hypothetical protein